ncbi:heme ABC exporter ATP-binding protein CcmA [Deinococcus detaillensis]|uniref:Heme ABC exporter ATP-binding protein CcmA n=1 Tax=Deinococcus detaillensis TaxID=2592048 RepID=A0A553UUE1_9DEIO|nr:heme ABC exporter ATP-binding protein CcmA [Deinococcus detaillensis]TSA83813.1 heme ABC exporter ATP-binding protein CcmA [Deinococcus detaillensis]
MDAPLSTPAAEYAVQLRGAWLRLGREVILRGVDLDIAAGEGVTLLGENGAGKTTLLRLLASSLRLTRGEGRVHGYDLRDSRSVRDHVHLMPVEGGTYPDLTAAENLDFALQMHRLSGDTGAALRRVGLEKAAERRVRFLSAGMRKRLNLARLSLLARPLTLVDEPFANLDAAGRYLALEVLAEVTGRGQTLLLAAHEPDLAAQVTGRALHLSAGSLTDSP